MYVCIDPMNFPVFTLIKCIVVYVERGINCGFFVRGDVIILQVLIVFFFYEDLIFVDK